MNFLESLLAQVSETDTLLSQSCEDIKAGIERDFPEWESLPDLPVSEWDGEPRRANRDSI